MQSTEFSFTEQNNLRIALTVQGQLDLKRLLTEHPDWDDEEIITELIDDQLTHGWYIVPQGQIRAQTHSLILTNTISYDEDGNLISIGTAYWYPGYDTEPYTTALLRQGYIIFEKGQG